MISVLRTLIEVAGYCLLGQGVLYLLAGAGREKNVIYLLFRNITHPVTHVVRKILPRQIPDLYIPFLSFVFLFCAWIGLAYLRLVL